MEQPQQSETNVNVRRTPPVAGAPFLPLIVALGAVACGDPGVGNRPEIFTLAKVRDAALSNQSIGQLPARDWVTARQQPIALLSPPFSLTSRIQVGDNDGFNVLPAFSEGRPAAYAVVEVWNNVPQVWLQPWYTLVTAYDPSNPGSRRLPGSFVLVDIGTESLFYSPFWEFVYVVVPPGTSVDRYRSAKELFEDGLEMHRGGAGAGILAPLTPPDVLPAVAQGSAPPSPVRPFTGDVVGTTARSTLRLNGSDFPFLSFGVGTFTWSSDEVIDEVALFLFYKLDSTGGTVLSRLPGVIGTGPLRAGRPARLSPTGVPQFGTLTRPYLTLVPAPAAVFIPRSQQVLRDYFQNTEGFSIPTIHPTIEQRPDARDYLLRLALNPACFADPSLFPASCRWLDSQVAIEASLNATAIQRLEMLFTSPVLFFNGQRVGR